ncbi:O-antigen ligase family protein [Haloimpatiens lingqiaonensis]|uniref:O-antigen ligase family protein n=1 Tax=Haloimpatiens lingqiaonensis TaxID=1380675 RepID=UPI00148529C7|nr:O-antigen ligase family protein [Haloimpatiens lingqiaonensis]
MEKLIFVFAIIIVLSTIFSVSPSRAITGHHRRFEGMISLISYLILFYFSFNYGEFKDHYIKLFALSSSIMGLYGIFQYFNLKELILHGVFQWGYGAYATIGNRNFLGSYITLFLPINIFLYIKYQKKMYLAWSCILFLCMLCTFTRSAWLAFVVYSIVLIKFIKNNKKHLKKCIKIYVVFIIISLSFNGITQGALFNRQLSIIKDANNVIMEENADRSGSGRIFIWKRAVKLIPDRPLLGSGPDTFDLVFMKRFGKECGMNHHYDKAHNEYLQIAVTEGIPALVLYLIIVISIVKGAYSRAKIEEEMIPIVLSLIGYLTQAFFNISVVAVAPIYWILLGYAAGIIFKNKKIIYD